ncbi:MAG: sulfide/dihydroorotate dehydrogenase-like FAD/NAD-binding protein [Candidatus Margulisbacteria bacterium]|jgi:ferredoxin--NADP+ reductase|nr:sulfide/dihydroorotate dehydrogenase-like FAD/NAD-binding protein [Candidatus Margulisiibacteriota bacterium]
MAQIKAIKRLSVNVYRLTVAAPEIAARHQPGQFIILRIDAAGERIPLTIADRNITAGTIDLIVQAVGKTTHQLVNLKTGEDILDLAGPLGLPTQIEKLGTVVMIGGGVGAAPLYPIAKGFKQIGNKVITILGARNKDLLVLPEEFAALSDELIIMTDDGSLGEKGLVTRALQKLIDQKIEIKKVVAIGPLIMMKFVAELAKKHQISIVVSLNSLMIDGTGMCGGCRVRVGGETQFTCVHGPEFDGQQVDFDTLLKRANTYKHEEQCRLEAYLKRGEHG